MPKLFKTIDYNKINRFGWILLTLITILAFAVIFFGPDINSEIADAPTFYSKLKDLVTIYFITGALILPVKNKMKITLNKIITCIGGIILIIKLIFAINVMAGIEYGPGIVAGWIYMILFILMALFIGSKIITIWHENRGHQTKFD